jgi:hypothetical protein
MQQIFDWTKTSRRGQVLKAVHNTAPPLGLYLTFPICASYGFIQLGKNLNGTCSEFDIIPAESRPEPAGRREKPKYAFCVSSSYMRPTFQHKWLHWGATSGFITLTDRLCPSCCVIICKEEERSSQFRLQVTDGNGNRKQLSMEEKTFPPESLAPCLTTAQLSFTEPTSDDIGVMVLQVLNSPILANLLP